MTIEQINQLSKEIHYGNRKRGFWDNERPMSEVLVLIRTEIDEAVEAHRKGRLCSLGINEDSEHSRIDTYKHLSIDAEFSTTLFKGYIKDTVEDELADTVIRILDLSDSGMINAHRFYKGLEHMMSIFNTEYDCETFIDMVDEFHSTMPNRKTILDMIATRLAISLLLLFHYCTISDIDIWWHVKEKLKYNATRPYKHGKKY